MSSIIIICGVIILLFIIIVLFNIRYKRKQISPEVLKANQEKKQEKKELKKAEKNNKKGKGNSIPTEFKKDEFLRPSDIVKEEQKKKKEQEELAKEEQKILEEKIIEIQSQKAPECESDNPDFVENKDNSSNNKEKPEIIEPNISEEIKNLSPEMKAILFGDVLKRKE